jgi:hypothetical protein
MLCVCFSCLSSSFLFYWSLISLEPKGCISELFSWMFELKMLTTSQTLETQKRGTGSQVTCHSENPTL